jgi:hypothetical protein
MEWKCQRITEIVIELAGAARSVKGDILMNIHGVPWKKDDFGGAIKAVVGQDFAELSAFVEYLSPMCYSHILGRDPAWINSVVDDLHQQSRSKIIPSIQVKEAYRQEVLSAVEFERCLLKH